MRAGRPRYYVGIERHIWVGLDAWSGRAFSAPPPPLTYPPGLEPDQPSVDWPDTIPPADSYQVEPEMPNPFPPSDSYQVELDGPSFDSPNPLPPADSSQVASSSSLSPVPLQLSANIPCQKPRDGTEGPPRDGTEVTYQ